MKNIVFILTFIVACETAVISQKGRNSNSRNTAVDTNVLWNNIEIPFIYDKSLDLESVGAISEALEDIELRTCMKLINRTCADDEDHIVFQAGEGCSSNFGRKGGGQTITLGDGCEFKSIVLQELMHTLGLQHEQSRPDRDDYVIIVEDNIAQGKEENFYKYNYDELDPREVDYDYNSIMHSWPSEFSSNGEPTIITRDPYFQTMIGHMRTLSVGDNTKINRMYNCCDTVRLTYNCNFEERDLCGYNQQPVFPDTVANTNWYRYSIQDGTASSTKIPNVDNTFAKSGAGNFMLFNATSNTGDYAYLKSMRYKSRQPRQCLKMSYIMNLESGSTASLKLYIAQIDSTTGQITILGEPVWTNEGTTGPDWRFLAVDTYASAEYKVVLRATTGGFDTDVIAIDDISVQDKPCDIGYYQMEHYDQFVANSTKGQSYDSPIMYDDDGYAYYLKIFPQGSNDASGGQMSVYVGLARGVNDDKLEWPANNRYIRMQVLDQNRDPIHSMDHYHNFLTDTSSQWDRPTEDKGPASGYDNMMRMSDIENVNYYMKHEAVIFSLKVQNMNNFRNDTGNPTEEDDVIETSTCEGDCIEVWLAIVIAVSSATLVLVVMSIALFCVIRKKA